MFFLANSVLFHSLVTSCLDYCNSLLSAFHIKPLINHNWYKTQPPVSSHAALQSITSHLFCSSFIGSPSHIVSSIKFSSSPGHNLAPPYLSYILHIAILIAPSDLHPLFILLFPLPVLLPWGAEHSVNFLPSSGTHSTTTF
ncbi:hypothetical protein ILYODFUR_021346 [Ilyodon furcidens]|uniref:Uncharacterized protein n=1 Tax=Ilyodon furcidens TaxID=33524 RepID=A0ABV0T2N9_9TELE